MKGIQKLLQWSNNFVNHLWYACRTCNGDSFALKVCINLNAMYENIISCRSVGALYFIM